MRVDEALVAWALVVEHRRAGGAGYPKSARAVGRIPGAKGWVPGAMAGAFLDVERLLGRPESADVAPLVRAFFQGVATSGEWDWDAWTTGACGYGQRERGPAGHAAWLRRRYWAKRRLDDWIAWAARECGWRGCGSVSNVRGGSFSSLGVDTGGQAA